MEGTKITVKVDSNNSLQETNKNNNTAEITYTPEKTTSNFQAVTQSTGSKEKIPGPKNWVVKSCPALEQIKGQNFANSFVSPLNNYNGKTPVITQSFGNGGGHLGDDLGYSGNPIGPPVFAIANGKVIAIKNNTDDWGNAIIIEHTIPNTNEKIYSQYAHLNKINITNNQIVTRGDKIGELGSTGKSTAPHLHFEIKNKNNFGPGYTGSNFSGNEKTYTKYNVTVTYYRPSWYIQNNTKPFYKTKKAKSQWVKLHTGGGEEEIKIKLKNTGKNEWKKDKISIFATDNKFKYNWVTSRLAAVTTSDVNSGDEGMFKFKLKVSADAKIGKYIICFDPLLRIGDGWKFKKRSTVKVQVYGNPSVTIKKPKDKNTFIGSLPSNYPTIEFEGFADNFIDAVSYEWKSDKVGVFCTTKKCSAQLENFDIHTITFSAKSNSGEYAEATIRINVCWSSNCQVP